VKRKTKGKIQFPSVESAEKYLVSLFEEYNWKEAGHQNAQRLRILVVPVGRDVAGKVQGLKGANQFSKKEK
jgi:hypothetical protein